MPKKSRERLFVACADDCCHVLSCGIRIFKHFRMEEVKRCENDSVNTKLLSVWTERNTNQCIGATCHQADKKTWMALRSKGQEACYTTQPQAEKFSTVLQQLLLKAELTSTLLWRCGNSAFKHLVSEKYVLNLALPQ